MKADDIRAALDGFNQKQGLATNRCQTGDGYLPFRGSGATAAKAFEALRDEIAAYAAGKVGTIYWRRTPEVSADFETDRFDAYCRLVISDKPERYPDIEALRSATAFGDPILPRVNESRSQR